MPQCVASMSIACFSRARYPGSALRPITARVYGGTPWRHAALVNQHGSRLGAVMNCSAMVVKVSRKNSFGSSHLRRCHRRRKVGNVFSVRCVDRVACVWVMLAGHGLERTRNSSWDGYAANFVRTEWVICRLRCFGVAVLRWEAYIQLYFLL